MANRDRESFDALLRRHRAARGMTQAGLAERSGLTAQAISMLERGVRRGPRITTVEFLAGALGLSAEEREEFQAAARAARSTEDPPGERAAAAAGVPGSEIDRPAPLPGLPGGRRRWRRRGAALGAIVLTAVMVAAWPGWWQAPDVTTDRAGHLVGARVQQWPSANEAVGPLQTQRVYHRILPRSFATAQEARLPAGVVPIVSYRIATIDVRSYVASVNRPIILIFQYNPERLMSAAAFLSAFEEQSRLIRSVHNARVRVATSAIIYQYQPRINPRAASCRYIPPAAYVDYYLAAVYDPFLRGIDRTYGGGFVVWQNCTHGRHRPRGLVEYGLGLGMPGTASCQPESRRTGVMYHDMAYLHANLPDLAVLEYWWKMSPGAPCAASWQFPAGSSTADLWRTLANRAFGL